MLSDTLNNSQVWGRNFDGQRYPKDYLQPVAEVIYSTRWI